MKKISNYQLFTLVVLYQIGSTIIFGFASSAGRAAWISVLISGFIGILINLVYLALMNMNPGLTLVEWFPAQLGKWVGVPIAWIYALELIYDGGRGIADLEILIPSTILPKTPIFLIQVIFISVVLYALFSGIEIVARIGELFLPLIIFLYILEVILIFSSDIINVQYIKPYLGRGWKNILDSVWPLGITQTFGQSIEFAMIWPMVKKPEKIMKTTLIAIISSTVFIASFNILAVLVLGENTFSNSTFPLYRLIRMINIGDFIENLDAISVLYFLTTSFFKTCIHLFSAVYAIQQLTNTENNKGINFLVAAIVMFLGVTQASSAPEHIKTGIKIVPYNLWLPLFYILPIMLLMIALIKRKIKIR